MKKRKTKKRNLRLTHYALCVHVKFKQCLTYFEFFFKNNLNEWKLCLSNDKYKKIESWSFVYQALWTQYNVEWCSYLWRAMKLCNAWLITNIKKGQCPLFSNLNHTQNRGMLKSGVLRKLTLCIETESLDKEIFFFLLAISFRIIRFLSAFVVFRPFMAPFCIV